MQTMSEADLTEWLSSPGTRALRVLLLRKRSEAVNLFLAGQPVDPVTQGRAAAYNDIEALLSGTPEKLKSVFDSALKEAK